MSAKKRNIFELEAACSDSEGDDESLSFSPSDLDFIASEYSCDEEVDPPALRRQRIIRCDDSEDGDEDVEDEEVPDRERTPDFDELLSLSPNSFDEVIGASAPTAVPEVAPSDNRKRATRFAMTLNNPTAEEEAFFRGGMSELTKFRMFGKENFGVAGKTPHLQCYIETKRNYSISALQKNITTAAGFKSRYAIQICVGTAAQNMKYCSKDGDVFQAGKIPAGQGKRTDLDKVCEDLASGKTVHAIALENPNQFVKYHAGISKLHDQYRNTARKEVTLGYWIFGDTGVGKSRWAHSLSPESTFVKEPNSKWWDGYAGEETVVIDDYRPSAGLGFSTLLHLADRYPHLVEKKGSMCQFNSKRLVITSPTSIDTTFANLDWMTEGKINQLKRRFVELEFGVGKLGHELKLCDVVHGNAD
jgi:hypothetical protein